MVGASICGPYSISVADAQKLKELVAEIGVGTTIDSSEMCSLYICKHSGDITVHVL